MVKRMSINTALNVRRVKISDLKMATYNPRTDLQPGDPDYEKLKKSLSGFGYVDPIVWNEKTGNVVGGHQRLKVLIESGATEVDVSVVNLNKLKEKALNLALNKIEGEWDMPKLKGVLADIASADFDLEMTGFDNQAIEELISTEGLLTETFDHARADTNSKEQDLGAAGDQNWFYITFYGKDDLFKKLQGILNQKGLIKGEHEVSADWLEQQILKEDQQ